MFVVKILVKRNKLFFLLVAPQRHGQKRLKTWTDTSSMTTIATTPGIGLCNRLQLLFSHYLHIRSMRSTMEMYRIFPVCGKVPRQQDLSGNR